MLEFSYETSTEAGVFVGHALCGVPFGTARRPFPTKAEASRQSFIFDQTDRPATSGGAYVKLAPKIGH
jgi:hypothetical protein